MKAVAAYEKFTNERPRDSRTPEGLLDMGLLFQSVGQLDKAIELYKGAVDVIEQHRASINTESSKIGFVSDKQRVYERLIDALYTKGQQSLAFEYIERSKSRALVDMLAAKSVAAMQPTQSADAANLARDFEQAEQESLAQVPLSAGEGKAGQRSIATQALARIRSAAPELSTLISVSSLPVARLHDVVPAGEGMIQYYYQGKNLYASVYVGGGIRMVRLDAEGLEGDIKKFREAIDKEEPAALDLSRKLYDRLIRPLEASIGGYQRLLIIPHGALHYLPFSALNDGSNYMLDRYALRTLPSVSVLPYLRPPQPAALRHMLVLGNPDLGNPRFDLPSAQVEAQRIAEKSGNAKLLLRGQASETTIKTMGTQYSMLHIASHGIFDTKTPLQSALMLARDDANDGKLTVGELYGLRLNADLVTLSACETGLGRINSGDDVVGLTRGFLYAGTRSVVASLWQVDDEATSQLMMQFYDNLSSKPKNEALRAAQLEVRKKYPHPYYWSAFYLTGGAQ